MIERVVCLGRGGDDLYFQFVCWHHPNDFTGQRMVTRLAISPDFRSFRSIGYKPIITRQLQRMIREELMAYLQQRI